MSFLTEASVTSSAGYYMDVARAAAFQLGHAQWQASTCLCFAWLEQKDG